MLGHRAAVDSGQDEDGLRSVLGGGKDSLRLSDKSYLWGNEQHKNDQLELFWGRVLSLFHDL